MSVDTDSLRALHVVLAAAFIGYLAFCISHAWSCWTKRQQSAGAGGRHLPWLATGSLGLVLVGAAWMDDHQLVRRQGVIAGNSIHVVRARENATTTELVAEGPVRRGQVIATFRGPAINQELRSAEAEVSSLGSELAGATLAAPEADAGLTLKRSDARSEWQSLASGIGTLSFAGADGSAALRAQTDEAEARLARMTALRAEGLVTVQDVEAARARAVTARETLRLSDRGQALAQAATQRMARLDAEIAEDRRRALARRDAHARALTDRLQDARARLSALQAQQEVRAPYDGHVVYRTATPDLARAGDVVLALADGAGFRARIQLPARELAHLQPDQPLPLRLKQALVETVIVGRYVGGAPTPDASRTAVIEVLCALPVEQFSQLANGGVAVRLDWTPPLHAHNVARAGFAAVALAALLWLVQRRRRGPPAATRLQAEPPPGRGTVAALPVSASALGTQMHHLGVRIREELGEGRVVNDTLTAIEWMMDRHPLSAARPLREGFHESAVPFDRGAALRGCDEALRERLRRLLGVVDAANEDVRFQHAAA